MSATPSKPVTPERIMQLAWGYAPPLIMAAAVRHGLFDALAERPLTVNELSQRIGAHPRGVRMVANALVALEFLAPDGERYTLTDESRAFLVKSSPGYRGSFFHHVDTHLIHSWLALPEVMKTGKAHQAVNDQNKGATFFEQFVEDIFPNSYPAAQALAKHLFAKSNGPVSLLDLASGSGVWGIAAAQKSKQVKVTAVDWPAVIPVTKRVAGKHGVADRFSYVEGDLHEAHFGEGHHVATLGHILHSEGEHKSRELLKKTFKALAPGGTIAIAEFLANDDRTGPPLAMLFAVNMLINTDDGDTFSFNEIASWLREAGFENPRTLEAPGPSPLILADRPA